MEKDLRAIITDMSTQAELSQTKPAETTKVILDPSFLFTDEGLSWIADAELQQSLAISAALYGRLADPAYALVLSQQGFQTNPDQVHQVRVAAETIEHFSYESVQQLPESVLAVRDALLSSDDPLAKIFADEWVFIKSQSIGVIRDDSKRTMEAFRAAGGQIYSVTRDQMTRGLNAIRRLIPRPLLRVMKSFGKFVSGRPGQVILLAGNAAALFVPGAGLPAWLVSAVLTGDWIIAGDP